MTCNICCEKYNKSLNIKVICPFANCNFEACKTCVRTYLLGTTNDPHCMNCKNLLPAKFLIDNHLYSSLIMIPSTSPAPNIDSESKSSKSR